MRYLEPSPMPDSPDDKLAELDRLLNDPETPMQAARVWDLLDEIAARAAGA